MKHAKTIALYMSVSMLIVLVTACTSAPLTPSATTTASASVPTQPRPTATGTPTPTPSPTPTPHPLTIESMREREYPGSDIVIEQTLESGSNYRRYIVSYRSEGLKIFALMTIPNGTKPKTGWPVVVFNHGYIPPAEYKTTERYVAYVDGFAKSGYIVLRSDYRGHDNSEGFPTGAYGSPDYTIDVLNAVASIKKYKDADSNRIGMWGHSMGGHITLRAMVTTKDIKAGVIWAGVVASYSDMMYSWRRPTNSTPIPGIARGWRQGLADQHGTPEQNQQFWDSISPSAYVNDLSGPLQLHHGTADTSVPFEFSEKLYAQVKQVGKPVEFFSYKGDNHNISINFSTAIQRSIQFFNKYVKGT
jgi:dipeptidyl aminopeptidase/acylaminoacyl peptidase